MDHGEAEGKLPPGEAEGRSAPEHCTAGVGKKDRLLVAGHCASSRAERVTLSHVCPRCHRVSLEDYIWWVSQEIVSAGKKKKQCNLWCAACGGQSNWRNPNRVLIIQDGVGASEAKVFRTHAPPQGCAVKEDRHQNITSSVASKKGVEQHWTVEKVARFIGSLGYREITLTSDTKPAIFAFRNRVAECAQQKSQQRMQLMETSHRTGSSTSQ